MKMTATFAFLAALLALAVCFASIFTSAAQAANVTFDWATVGNPGNVDDIHGDGYGGVAYTYRISKTEVTNAQYTDFLNAVAETDTNSLYKTLMGSTTRGGITRSGSPGSYTYAVKADSIDDGPGGPDGDDYTYANKPVVYVSFFDAMRFTNWLENGQPTGSQDASTTEAGVYDIDSGLNEVRKPSTRYFIPSEDEWYKAAYYDPNGGDSVYYNYPTSTDTLPNNNRPSSDTGNSANFFNGGYTTGISFYSMTDVGAYALTDNSYGTFDQGGNAWEWNEAVISSSFRGIRGGGWNFFNSGLHAVNRNYANVPAFGNSGIGFRVASIPEPSSMLLGALASVGLLMRRRRLS